LGDCCEVNEGVEGFVKTWPFAPSIKAKLSRPRTIATPSTFDLDNCNQGLPLINVLYHERYDHSIKIKRMQEVVDSLST
jgi:hypothetical protein